LRNKACHAIKETENYFLRGDLDAGPETRDVVATTDGVIVQQDPRRVVEAIRKVVKERHWDT
jgi:hypothetical protein